MFLSTIYGTKIKLKKDLTEQEIKHEINKKMGFNESNIFLYNEYIGLFNTKEEQGNSKNIFKDYGVPDYIFWAKVNEEKDTEYINYRTCKLVSTKNIEVPDYYFSDNPDKDLVGKIFRHFLIEPDMEYTKPIVEKDFDLTKYLEMLDKDDFNIKSISDTDKDVICDNIDKIVQGLFSNKI